MPSDVHKRTKRKKYKTKFHKNAEELKEFVKENDIKLSELWGYLRRRNNKKIQKGN